MASNLISLSDIDEERFCVKTAKAPNLRFEDISQVMALCETNKVEFLIARCNTSDQQAAQQMERLGFLLMDTLMYYSFNLKDKILPERATDVLIRAVRPGEEERVGIEAGEIFQGYPGHYNMDPRLDKKKCDEVYSDWVYRLCISSETSHGVLLAVNNEQILGFGSMRINNPSEGEGLLFGITPLYRGKGIYREIMVECLNWCADKGLERMIISTQITNLASQKAWIRLGFEPTSSFYTYHKWFI